MSSPVCEIPEWAYGPLVEWNKHLTRRSFKDLVHNVCRRLSDKESDECIAFHKDFSTKSQPLVHHLLDTLEAPRKDSHTNEEDEEEMSFKDYMNLIKEEHPLHEVVFNILKIQDAELSAVRDGKCFHFIKHDWCKYGSDCYFAHPACDWQREEWNADLNGYCLHSMTGGCRLVPSVKRYINRDSNDEEYGDSEEEEEEEEDGKKADNLTRTYCRFAHPVNLKQWQEWFLDFERHAKAHSTLYSGQTLAKFRRFVRSVGTPNKKTEDMGLKAHAVRPQQKKKEVNKNADTFVNHFDILAMLGDD